jgi:hypothetical protein
MKIKKVKNVSTIKVKLLVRAAGANLGPHMRTITTYPT